MLQVRVLRGAPIQAPFAKRQRHLAYAQTFGGSSPSGSTRQTADMQLRTRSLKPEWRGSGLLTRRPVDRNHSRPPRTLTATDELSELLIRGLFPNAGSNPAWSSCVPVPQWQRERVESAFSARSSRARHTRFLGRGNCARSPSPRSFCAVMHRVRQLDCLSSETGSSPVQRAILGVQRSLEALFVRNEGRWFKSSHSDQIRRQHWRAARSYKPGQRTAVDGRDRNPGRRPNFSYSLSLKLTFWLGHCQP